MGTESARGKLRVAQLIESMTMGGAENLAVRIANALAAAGHESHLIVTGSPGVLSERIAPEVQAHYLHYERASVNFPPAFLLSVRRGSRLLRQVITAHRIQVVQTHLPGANFWGLLLAWRRVCPVLATIHNNQEFRYGDQDSALRAAFRKKAYKQILATCAGTIAVSAEVKASLIRDLDAAPEAADRISVVTNGVALPAPISARRRQEIRSELGLADARPLILAAGRCGEQKNFADLVEAAAVLRRTRSDFQLVIAGEGPLLEPLRAQVAERGLEHHVLLPGNLLNLGQVMQAADIFVMSSLWEGLPLVLLEAMAAGLPPVGYAIAGVAEILTREEEGMTVPTGDVAGLAGALDALLADPTRRARMGAAARELVAARFDFATVCDSLQDLYRSVARA